MKRDHGQLALGLAFMFTASLAIFSLVFQSSLITREKMQLQQTSDFAALTASDVQRRYLNTIRELNQRIENEYKDLQKWLKINVMPSMAAMCTNYEVATAYAEMFSAFSKKNDSKGDVCDKGCGGFDSFMKNARIAQFQAAQTNYARQIVALLQEANQKAFDVTLETYLVPENMPVMLRGWLENKFGRKLTLRDVQAEYAKGGDLKKKYDIRPVSSVWLFEPKIEERIFPVDHTVYNTIYVYGEPVACAPLYAYPLPQPSLAKIVRKGNFTTNYIAAVKYSPVNSEAIKKWVHYGLTLRDRKEADSDSKIPLIRDRQEMTDASGGTYDRKMMALSLAKPYGGTFPREGSRQQPPGGMGNRGSVGAEFKGSKLIGIADTRELDGYRINLDQVIEKISRNGFLIDRFKSFTEDYLH